MWLWNITSTVYLPPATTGFCPLFLFKHKECLKIHGEYSPSASDVQTWVHYCVLKIQIRHHLPSQYPTFTSLINLIKKNPPIIAFQRHNLPIRLGADMGSSQLLVTPAVRAHTEPSPRCSQYQTLMYGHHSHPEELSTSQRKMHWKLRWTAWTQHWQSWNEWAHHSLYTPIFLLRASHRS